MKGEEYVMTVKTCLDAITGVISTDAAPASFIRATEEAGMGVIAIVHSCDKHAADTRTDAIGIDDRSGSGEVGH
jgi:hypothetical protein